MRYCVRVLEPTAWPGSSPAAARKGIPAGQGRLDDGNLRGERRWERNVAHALLTGGREVGAHQAVLQKSPTYPTWLDEMSRHSVEESVYIAHGGPNDAGGADSVEAKHYVMNFHGCPDGVCDKVSALAQRRGRANVVATANFRVLRSDFERLRANLGSDLVEWLPTPAVPAVYAPDLRANKVLLWTTRGIDLVMSGSPPTPAGEKATGLWPWIVDRLTHGYTLEILTGLGTTDLEFRRFPSHDITAWFWSLPHTVGLAPVRDRITVHGALDWYELDGVYRRARAVVGPPQILGGPPIEAGAYGIPVIGVEHASVFHDAQGQVFPEYVFSSTHNGIGLDHLALLDRLLDDDVFFQATGDAYRRQVEQTYTYAAFLQRLDQIANSRGWL